MARKFLARDGASLYYLDDSGAGGFLRPPGHAEHSQSILTVRGGHEFGWASLSYAAGDDNGCPVAVRRAARNALRANPGDPTDPEWITGIYRYFAHCYSLDGVNRSVAACVTYGAFWDNAEQESDADQRRHLGYLFVREHDSGHEPRLGLMGRPS